MISVTIGGASCWLLPYQVGDASPLGLGVRMPLDIRRGLTGSRSRSQTGNSPRYSFAYRAVMTSAEFAALRAASLSAQDEPIVVPLWPFAWRPGVDTQTIAAGLIVAYTADFATYAINPGSFAGYTYAAPLLMGYLNGPPRMASVKDGIVVADIKIDEDATLANSFNVSVGILPSDTTFTDAAGYTAPVFPFVADWTEMPTPAIGVTDVERTVIGPGRKRASTWWPQKPEQIQQASFTAVGQIEAARFLAWWIRRGGQADAHWVPSAQSLWHLAASASAGATSITLKLDTPAPAVGSILALNGATTEIVRVTGVSGSVLTLAAPLVNAWLVGDTRVTPAFLGTHIDDELQLEFSPAGWICTMQVGWREAAAETTLPAGETRGTTVGRLPGRAWFFKIDLDYNGAIATTYLTNWESGASGASVGSHTWTYNPCDFSGWAQDIDNGSDSFTFKMRWYSGCPLNNWQPGVLAARGFLTIYVADVDAAGAYSNFAQVYTGEMGTPTADGPNYSVRVQGANAILARRGPRQVVSTLCGTNLFAPRCVLALSDWTFNAVVSGISGNVVTVNTITRANGGGLPSGFGAADWFALGWLGWTSGGLPQRNGCMTSTAVSGGAIALTLDRPVSLTIGASVTIVPGCDRQGSTCRNKFANYTNFRGFEYTPAVSPNFVIPQNTAAGGKK